MYTVGGNMKRYYGHKNLCYISNWSGDVGDRIQVSKWMYIILMMLGFRTSVVEVSDTCTTHEHSMGWFRFILTMCHL